jgi:hypothetical protein
MNQYTSPKLITALNAVTATTASSAINIKGAKKVTVMGTRADHGSGSTAFSVTVSVDNSTFVTYNKLITNVTNTNGQTPIRAASFSLGANGSEFAVMDMLNDTFTHMKVTATKTTDGTHTAKVLVEY